MQEAESHPQCRRLQLRDLIISEMQRLTKYPLLLENIIKHTEGRAPDAWPWEAAACSPEPGPGTALLVTLASHLTSLVLRVSSLCSCSQSQRRQPL